MTILPLFIRKGLDVALGWTWPLPARWVLGRCPWLAGRSWPWMAIPAGWPPLAMDD